MNYLVSVIIPVYNVLPYISEALESVIYQTYENLEIIVIDDGSTDGSEKVCDEYVRRDKRIVVIHQKNKGLSTARNVGLDRMTGDVVAFLDSDDAYDHRMIETALKEMEKQRADIVVCGYSTQKTQRRMRTKAGKVTGRQSRILNRDDVLIEVLENRINSAPWNKLYKNEIWNDLRFPDGYVYEGTYSVFNIFDRTERTVIIDEKLIMHRNRRDSICNTCSIKNIHDAEYAFDHFIAFVEEHIPDLFSRVQSERLRQAHVRGMMADYMKYSYKNPEDLEGRAIVRRMLQEAKDVIGLENCNIATRTAYYPVLFFPRSCWLLCWPYRTMRKMMQKNINNGVSRKNRTYIS